MGEFTEQDPGVDLAQNGMSCTGETLRRARLATR
jgi:hypothetical protein